VIGLCIGLLAYIEQLSGHQWLAAPFAASAVILVVFPASPFAGPKAYFGGYCVSTLAGLVVALVLNSLLPMPIVLGFAVGAAAGLMLVTNTVHPPAAGVPLLIVQSKAGPGFFVAPILLGTLTLFLMVQLHRRLRASTA
jgi:CBS-domain-containing membrane protein